MPDHDIPDGYASLRDALDGVLTVDQLLTRGLQLLRHDPQLKSIIDAKTAYNQAAADAEAKRLAVVSKAQGKLNNLLSKLNVEVE